MKARERSDEPGRRFVAIGQHQLQESPDRTGPPSRSAGWPIIQCCRQKRAIIIEPIRQRPRQRPRSAALRQFEFGPPLVDRRFAAIGGPQTGEFEPIERAGAT
jgi:hypothetical protein